jgi:aminoglycoside 3-N-acetyltransferase
MGAVPDWDVIRGKRPVTRSELLEELRALGIHQGAVLMVHARISSLGWVVGGSETVVRSLLDALGPTGTLMAYAGWEDDPWGLTEWPEEWQRAYRAGLPPFDPELSEADHEMGRLPERIRTWPGARASTGHVMRMVAIGARAEWLVADQAWDHPQGPGSPLAKLVEADGQVLMLGAPLETLTILHHAEALVDSREKRLVTYSIPVREGARVVWKEVSDHDTSSRGAFPYERFVPPGRDAFDVIGTEAVEAGCGKRGRVAEAPCHLFEAKALVRFAVAWMQSRFGNPDDPREPEPSASAAEDDRHVADYVEGGVGRHGGQEAPAPLEDKGQPDAHRRERGDDQQERDPSQVHQAKEDA